MRDKLTQGLAAAVLATSIGSGLAVAEVIVAPAAQAAGGGTYSFDHSTALPGERLFVKGSLNTTDRRLVYLEQKFGPQWRRMSSARAAADGTFKIRASLPKLEGTYVYRVVSPQQTINGQSLPQIILPEQTVTVAAPTLTITSVVPAALAVNQVSQIDVALTPRRNGRVVALQTRVGRSWRQVSAFRISADGPSSGSLVIPTGVDASHIFRIAALSFNSSTPTFGQVFSVKVGAGSPVAGDSDLDTISDVAESGQGTDVNNPDTDGDGLLDGDEVNIHTTDPTKTDTDDDGLGDLVEVTTFRTLPTKADSDADGIIDLQEIRRGLAPRRLDADADADRLADGEERAYGTNVAKFDTDGDGVGDGDEVAAGTDPLSQPSFTDSDGDGMSDIAETAFGSSPFRPDTDFDGLTDPDEQRYGTSPTSSDTDGDGLDDGDEVFLAKSDPLSGDGDNDGLSDAKEYQLYRTNPLRADTDGDGLDDNRELFTTNTDPRAADTDADTLTDGEEDLTFGTDPRKLDTDGDTLTDGAEVKIHGSSPFLVDTDGDLVLDPEEIRTYSTDPNDPLSRPALWSDISAGAEHSCAVKDDGTLWCWGYNTNGQLATGNTTSVRKPTAAAPGFTIKRVEVGSSTDATCAITTGDDLLCWGNNSAGQVGSGATAPAVTAPRLVSAGWRDVAPGSGFTCGIKTNGTLWCWGAAPTGSSTTPVQVGAETTWRNVETGDDNACATRADGSLWCWGANAEAGLGSASGQVAAPTQVPGSGYTELSVGAGNACAVRSSDLYCWGDNTFGQIGDSTTTRRLSPTLVEGSDWREVNVSATPGHTCATRTDNSLWCWGSNTQRQLGAGVAGTSAKLLFPHEVKATPIIYWTRSSVGGEQSCGLTTDSRLYCWGDNSRALIGDNTLTDRPNPTPVRY